MMNGQLENTLIEALDLLEQGMAVETILARYPEQAAVLRPYLQTAADLGRAATPAPAAAQLGSRRAFLMEAAELERARPPVLAHWLRRLGRAAVVLLLLVFVGGWLLVYAAGQALPGSTMYGAKLALEQVRLDMTSNPEAAVDLIERFREERLAEAAALIADGREVRVTLVGTVEEMAGDGWIVSGIPVQLDAGTVVHGAVEPGFEVELTGLTKPTWLLAERVEVMVGRLPEADGQNALPDATPTPSSDPLATPQSVQERPLTPVPTVPDPIPPTPQPSPTSDAEADSEGPQTTRTPDQDSGGEGQPNPDREESDDETPEADRSDDETPEADHSDDETPEADHSDDETPEADHSDDETPEPERD